MPSWGQAQPRAGERGGADRAPAKDSPDDAKRQDEIKKAKDELDRARADMEKMRAQMEDAAARMHKLQDRLHQLEGSGKKTEHITVIIRDGEGKTRTIEVPQGDVSLPQRGPGFGAAPAVRGFRLEVDGAPGAGTRPQTSSR